MGNSASDFEHAQFAQLGPQTAINIFGIGNCFQHQRDYVMKEKILSLSGDDFAIEDENGNPSGYKISGKVFSLSDKKKLLDGYGNTIGQVREKIMTLHKRMYLVDADGLVRVVLRRAHFFQLAAAAEGWVLQHPVPVDKIDKSETKSRPADFRMGGNWRAKNFICVNSENQVIVKTQRKGLNVSNIVFGKQTYIVSVPAFVDSAFCILLCCALDEMYRDDN